MCEALYNQNKTLLSAVESISAVALSAAVTDYYNEFEERARVASRSQSRSRSQGSRAARGAGQPEPQPEPEGRRVRGELDLP